MAEVWTPAAFDYFTASLVDVAEMNALNNSLRFLKEVYYQELTATTTNITATTEGTANTVLAGASQTYEAVPHMVELSLPQARPDTGAAARSMTFVFEDSTTVIGYLATIVTPAAAAMFVPIQRSYRFTPTAAAHTYNVKAFVSAGTGQIQAGAGGAGTTLPGFIRITRVPT